MDRTAPYTRTLDYIAVLEGLARCDALLANVTCGAVTYALGRGRDEIDSFHLSTLRLTYDEAVCEYEKRRETRLGRLLANRELPILRKAWEIMNR